MQSISTSRKACDDCSRPPTSSSSRRGPRHWHTGVSARPASRGATAGSGLRITGHGADGERANWVAFGDDAAVSGGLVGGTDSEPVFCGDAIADPLTGLHAALGVAESLIRGGGELIELSMAAVAATYATDHRTTETRCVTMPAPSPPASELGADDDAVERLLAERRLASC